MRLPSRCASALPWLALAVLTACSSKSRPRSLPVAAVSLAGVSHGQLVDLYGVAEPNGSKTLQLHRRDVLVGHELPDTGERSAYEVLSTPSGSGRPRVAIRHPVDSPAFAAAAAKLRARVSHLNLDGSTEALEIPWGSALELRFGGDLGLADGAFDPGASIQLLAGRDRVVSIRTIARGERLIVDPQMHGGVGSPAQHALVLGGPALPGVDNTSVAFHAVPPPPSQRAVQQAPRILGELGFFLERVDDLNEGVQQATVFKNGISHDIDRGDVLKFFVQGNTVPVVVTEIVADPTDDNLQPGVQHVRTRVLRSNQLEQIDPANLPNYPSNPQSPAGEAWLVANAPRAVLVAPYEAEQRNAAGTIEARDDLRNFVTFTPTPLPLASGQPSPPNENVSPFAGALVRFSSPIDLTTTRPLDTLFLATRDLLDPAGQQAFILAQNMEPAQFTEAKYFTPHLVHSRLTELTGNQRILRVQPPLGFYLDDEMRRVDEGQPFVNKRFKYYLHIVQGPRGITGLNGLPLEFGRLTAGLPGYVALPFSLDTRNNQSGAPLFPNNLVATVARRFEARDEDEQPSYYLPTEVQNPGTQTNVNAFPHDDLFGSVVYLVDGTLSARPTARIRQIVDNLNQTIPPPQNSAARYCPTQVGSEQQVATATAAIVFGQPIQNPLNPYGARLQSAWREIDVSLSRQDPLDFNLDVEAMYWAPFAGRPVIFDQFERVSLFLGHSEKRPENCLGAFGALPTMPNSGLATQFADNYVSDVDLSGNKVPGAAPHPAFVDRHLVVDPSQAITEPNGVNSYLPLPKFQRPYFVWRDERVMQQGAASRRRQRRQARRQQLRSLRPVAFPHGSRSLRHQWAGRPAAVQLGRLGQPRQLQPGADIATRRAHGRPGRLGRAAAADGLLDVSVAAVQRQHGMADLARRRLVVEPGLPGLFGRRRRPGSAPDREPEYVGLADRGGRLHAAGHAH